jgi:hypothetical protein
VRVADEATQAEGYRGGLPHHRAAGSGTATSPAAAEDSPLPPISRR